MHMLIGSWAYAAFIQSLYVPPLIATLLSRSYTFLARRRLSIVKLPAAVLTELWFVMLVYHVVFIQLLNRSDWYVLRPSPFCDPVVLVMSMHDWYGSPDSVVSSNLDVGAVASMLFLIDWMFTRLNCVGTGTAPTGAYFHPYIPIPDSMLFVCGTYVSPDIIHTARFAIGIHPIVVSTSTCVRSGAAAEKEITPVVFGDGM